MRRLKVEVDELKAKIIGLLGRIEFEGHFDVIITSTNNNFHETIMDWVLDCKERRIWPEHSTKFKNILGFLFKPRNTRYRGILVKEKNKYFLVLFLDKHKYYERERERLGI